MSRITAMMSETILSGFLSVGQRRPTRPCTEVRQGIPVLRDRYERT